MPDTKNIPIRWGKYINHDMEEEKVMFIGAEKAIYDSNGRRLDEKLVDMEGSLSDAFSETKDYAVGEYCVYTNRVFKFTKAKTAGEWDGTAVIPVSLAQEISEVSRGIAALNSHFQSFGNSLFTNGKKNNAGLVQIQTEGFSEPNNNGLSILLNLASEELNFDYKKDGVWKGRKALALKSDLSRMISGPAIVRGISNKGKIAIKVNNNDYRYGTILLVVSSHIVVIEWAATAVTLNNLWETNVTATTSSDGLTLTITMHSNYEHGFFVVGGGCCAGDGPTITLSNK